MAEPFIAEIRMFGFNFAPIGWAACDGQVLPIAQNTALFSLLGTNFGGDGRTNFALPNLMGSSAIGVGQGAGLSNREVGSQGGAATVTLGVAQMPPHQHELRASMSPDSRSPLDAAFAPTGAVTPAYRIPGATVAMVGSSVTAAGQSAPHENRQPCLTAMFCIAMQGIFPPRN